VAMLYLGVSASQETGRRWEALARSAGRAQLRASLSDAQATSAVL